jgi:hypothetical protein
MRSRCARELVRDSPAPYSANDEKQEPSADSTTLAAPARTSSGRTNVLQLADRQAASSPDGEACLDKTWTHLMDVAQVAVGWPAAALDAVDAVVQTDDAAAAQIENAGVIDYPEAAYSDVQVDVEDDLVNAVAAAVEVDAHASAEIAPPPAPDVAASAAAEVPVQAAARIAA